MKRTMLWGMTLVMSLALAAGCGKKDKDGKKDDGKKDTSKKVTDNKKPGQATPDQKDPKDEKDQPKKISSEDVIKKIETCWGYVDAKDKDKFKSCYTADSTMTFVDSMPAMSAKGPDAVVELVTPFFDAFDPLEHELSLILVNGTNVAVLGLATGTQTAPLMGMEGTGSFGLWTAQHATFTETGDIVDDKHWTDMGTMMAQLGHMPNPEAPATETTAWETPMRIVAKNDETEKANLELLESLDEAYKNGDADAAMAAWADDGEFRYVAGAETTKGKDAIAKGTKEWMAMHSEMKMGTTNIWAAGDWVVSETWIEATMAADMGEGMPTKGKSYKAQYLDFTMIKDGKIQKHWIFANHGKMMADLGLMPDPSKKGDKPQ